MSNQRQSIISRTSAPVLITLPKTGTAAQRRAAVPVNVRKLRFPAESGGLFVTFGSETVDGPATASAYHYVPWGAVDILSIPTGSTHFSVATLAADDWTVVIQGVE